MHTTSALSDRAREVLGSALEDDEDVLAWGRADHLLDISEAPGGSGYTFLGITATRIVWTSLLQPRSPSILLFSSLVSWSAGDYLQRWVVALRHAPVRRPEHVPRRRFLRWEWGNAEVLVERTETIFEFSRRETAAARRLRERLQVLIGPEDAPLSFRPGTREARTAGSRRIFRFEER